MRPGRRRWIAASVAILGVLLVGIALLTKSCWHPAGSRQGQVASAFARALVAGRYDDAHRFLSRELASEIDVAKLREQYESMVAYGERPATSVAVVGAMDYWPDKQPGDVGWAYAAIWGEGFSEAVTVTVAEEDGKDVIRVLEWGRP